MQKSGFDMRWPALLVLALVLVVVTHRESAGQPPETVVTGEIEALQRQRVDTLRQLVDELQVRHEHGIVADDVLIRANHRLLAAELDLAREPAERIDICRRQLDLFQHLEALTSARFETETIPHSDVLEIQAERMLVEIQLLKEQAAAE